MTEIITVRVDAQTKQAIKRHRIRVSEVARRAIQEEIERREREESLEALRRMRQLLERLDLNRVIAHIREDRSQR